MLELPATRTEQEQDSHAFYRTIIASDTDSQRPARFFRFSEPLLDSDVQLIEDHPEPVGTSDYLQDGAVLPAAPTPPFYESGNV